jgi:site-specific DNA-methyltransferase (adenine-specific)
MSKNMPKKPNTLTQIEWAPIESVTPYARNPRKIGADAVSAVAGSIKEFGFKSPIIVDVDRVIINGHTRLKAAQQLGLKEVPVVVASDLTPEQVRAYRIADNRSAEFSKWDEDFLKVELDDIGDIDLSFCNVDEMLAELEEQSKQDQQEQMTEGDPDAVPAEAQGEPVSQRGEVFELGPHRLMCGDGSKAESVAMLMGGDNADMVYTDPPYGIAYSGAKYDGVKAQASSLHRNKADMIVGDDNDFDPSFLLDMFPKNIEMFIWGFQYYPHKLGRGGIICWNKKQESQAECAHGDFELCWSRHERNKMCWLKWGGFNSKEKNEDRLHTTQKPVALATWFFENWGNNKKVIVDLFAGSGSTLIAAAKTGRICRAMEIAPRYCDVIRRRWTKFAKENNVEPGTGALE